MGQLSTKPDAAERGAERRIYARLRTQIEDGTLAADTRLVSTRALAAELGVSRTTVTAAYEQLAAEGFVVTSAGKAARVGAVRSTPCGQAQADSALSENLPPALSLYGQRVAALKPYSMTTPHARIDFKYGSVASRDFPALGWQRAYRAELVKRQANHYYGQSEGEERLRSALQGYLRRARGLICDADQILVVHGSQQGLDLAGGRARARGWGLSAVAAVCRPRGVSVRATRRAHSGLCGPDDAGDSGRHSDACAGDSQLPSIMTDWRTVKIVAKASA